MTKLTLSMQRSSRAKMPDTRFRQLVMTLKRVGVKIMHWPRLVMEILKNRRLDIKKIETGLQLLKGKLFSRAMLEFQEAISLSFHVAVKRLEFHFTTFEAGNEYESALSVGVVLLIIKNEDKVLANRLGNLARKTGNNQQANNLYKKALRIDPEFKLAFDNLAASLGNVDKFDEEISQLLNRFIVSEHFVVPFYRDDPELEAHIIADLTQRKEAWKADTINQLERERVEKEAAFESYAVLKIGVQIKKVIEMPVDPTYEEVLAVFQKAVEDCRSATPSAQTQHDRQKSLFNLGLYAFQHADIDRAEKCFQELAAEEAKLEYLEMMNALVWFERKENERSIELFFDLLGQDRFNRYYHLNLGRIYRKLGNELRGQQYLVMGAALLEKSEGLYRIVDMMQLADEQSAAGLLKKALSLYQTVLSEQNLPEAWIKCGRLLLKMKNPTAATDAFLRLLELEPNNETAQHQLRQIHDRFVKAGEDALVQNSVGKAAVLVEKAVKAEKKKNTLEKAIHCYKILKKTGKVDELVKERYDLIQKEKEAVQESQRQTYIRQSNIFMQRKAYRLAAEKLEKAFLLKIDKPVFIRLEMLYQNLDEPAKLQHLHQRWEKMNLFEEEKKRRKKQPAQI